MSDKNQPLSVEAGRKLLQKQAAGKYPESKLQQQCVKKFREFYPQFALLLFAIPNGGHRNIITAKIMNAEGALSGVSDLFLSVPRGKFHGMYIEMKYGKNGLSDVQKAFLSAVEGQQYATAVCYTIESFLMETNKYLSL